jgi:hypothetical protein
MWSKSGDNKRPKLYVDIRRGNCSLLNAQPEQATAKHEQQADTGTDGDYAFCLGISHLTILSLWLMLDRYDCHLQCVLIHNL